jgi:hypothetical protein
LDGDYGKKIPAGGSVRSIPAVVLSAGTARNGKNLNRDISSSARKFIPS